MRTCPYVSFLEDYPAAFVDDAAELHHTVVRSHSGGELAYTMTESHAGVQQNLVCLWQRAAHNDVY
jgi:hypothetical protein